MAAPAVPDLIVISPKRTADADGEGAASPKRACAAASTGMEIAESQREACEAAAKVDRLEQEEAPRGAEQHTGGPEPDDTEVDPESIRVTAIESFVKALATPEARAQFTSALNEAMARDALEEAKLNPDHADARSDSTVLFDEPNGVERSYETEPVVFTADVPLEVPAPPANVPSAE